MSRDSISPCAGGVWRGCATAAGGEAADGSFWRGVGGCIAVESKRSFVDDDVDILRESLDELPNLGQRRPSFKGQVFAEIWQGEQLAERPADPEILLNAGGLGSLEVFNLQVRKAAVPRRHF